MLHNILKQKVINQVNNEEVLKSCAFWANTYAVFEQRNIVN